LIRKILLKAVVLAFDSVVSPFERLETAVHEEFKGKKVQAPG